MSEQEQRNAALLACVYDPESRAYMVKMFAHYDIMRIALQRAAERVSQAQAKHDGMIMTDMNAIGNIIAYPLNMLAIDNGDVPESVESRVTRAACRYIDAINAKAQWHVGQNFQALSREVHTAEVQLRAAIGLWKCEYEVE